MDDSFEGVHILSIEVVWRKLPDLSTAVFDACAPSSDCVCAVVLVGSMCRAEAGVAVAMLSGLFES